MQFIKLKKNTGDRVRFCPYVPEQILSHFQTPIVCF